MASGLKKGIIKIARTLSRNSPTIFTWLGVTGVVATTATAINATIKAVKKVDEEGAYNHARKEDVSKLDYFKDTIKLVWPYYISTIIVGGSTIFCITSSNSINAKRNAALASVYALTETAFKEYRHQVVKTIGEKKEREIKDEVYKEKIIANPLGSATVIDTGKGKTLCFDAVFGRYFTSDIEYIRKVENELNYELLQDLFVPYNSFSYHLGLPQSKAGKDWGWDIEEGKIEFVYSSQLAEGGVPCLVIDSYIELKQDYRDY